MWKASTFTRLPSGPLPTLTPPLCLLFSSIFAFGQCPHGRWVAPILTFETNRYLHSRLRREDPTCAATIRLASCDLWAQFLRYRDLVRQATCPSDAIQTDGDESALQESRAQILQALQLLDLSTAECLIIPQHDERCVFKSHLP
jgi:hypothetical protein